MMKPFSVVSYSLKSACSNLIHVTCNVYVLNLAAETISKCYSEVNNLISQRKAGLFKPAKRFREFQRQCTSIPQNHHNQFLYVEKHSYRQHFNIIIIIFNKQRHFYSLFLKKLQILTKVR